MADVTDAQFKAAESRGRKMPASEPRALAAQYDRATGRVVVDLVNGCTYAFAARLVQDLHGASDDTLAGVVVDGQGFNLHWPALAAGILGTRTFLEGGNGQK